VAQRREKPSDQDLALRRVSYFFLPEGHLSRLLDPQAK